MPAQGIEVELDVDLRDHVQQRWPSRQRLSFVATQAGRAVRLFGENHKVTAVSAPFWMTAHGVTFCTGPFAVGDRVTVAIDFVAHPYPWKGIDATPRGLRTWADGDATAIGPVTEPNGSSHWFYSPQARFDTAAKFASVPALDRVQLRVTAPGPDWTVVGPDGLGVRQDDTWTFQQATPMPVYALSFAASRDWLPQKPLGKTAAGQAIVGLGLATSGADDAFAVAPKVVAWMEQHFAPYPYAGQIALVTIPHFGSAMEHVGNVWFGRALASWGDVVAHELVHQWWGNTVRMAGWEHAWLNEGVTEWLTDFHVLPALFSPGTSLLGRRWVREQAASLCGSAANGPLRLPDGTNGQALWPERNYHYFYGAMVLHMLTVRLAERHQLQVLTLMKEWFELQRGKAVTTEQFRDFVATRTGDPDYWHAFFQAWVYSKPCPALVVDNYAHGAGKTWFRIRRQVNEGQQALTGLRIRLHGTAPAVHDVVVDLDAGETEADVEVVMGSTTKIEVDPDWHYMFKLARGSSVPGSVAVTP